jgi:hypothetical protein
MLQIVVDDCRLELKIDDSKEMMVGIAYSMPFKLEQFELFHVSLHIATKMELFSGNCHFKGFLCPDVLCSPYISPK